MEWRRLYFGRSRKLLIRTGLCFLLNGFIFLGSLFVQNSVFIPILQWILPDQRCHISYMKKCLNLMPFIVENLRCQCLVLMKLCWYNDIAKHGFAVTGRSGHSVVESSRQNDALTSDSKIQAARPAGLGGIMIGIGEPVYSVLLLSFFFLELYATGFIPLCWEGSQFPTSLSDICILLFRVCGKTNNLFLLQQAQRLSKLFPLKQDNGVVQNSEGFPCFMQSILYRKPYPP
ncbi:hypothetical protein PTKIN_Ptkin10aG0186700 [Pterospermum kingtungense]